MQHDLEAFEATAVSVAEDWAHKTYRRPLSREFEISVARMMIVATLFHDAEKLDAITGSAAYATPMRRIAPKLEYMVGETYDRYLKAQQGFED